MLNRARPHLDINKILEQFSSANPPDEEHIANFENNFCKYIDTCFCKAIDYGRYALSLALKTLNISKGDEVIVQSFICNVAIDAILSHGAKPVLVDSSLKDFNISPSEIRKKITSKTKAIIIAHLYGIPCDIDEILSIAEENNCFLIEDCAHCINSKYKEKKVGTFGDISFFSFNFDKPLSTGNGGMLVVNNKKLVDKAKEILDKLKRIDAQEDKKIVYGLFIQHILTNRDYPCTFLC
jgi:perosamine synthetase